MYDDLFTADEQLSPSRIKRQAKDGETCRAKGAPGFESGSASPKAATIPLYHYTTATR